MIDPTIQTKSLYVDQAASNLEVPNSLKSSKRWKKLGNFEDIPHALEQLN